MDKCLVDGCPLGTIVEVCVEADAPDLLGLPFEALRLPPTEGHPDGRLLATQAPVVMSRRPIGVSSPPSEALAGPLKILVAVGAPDEDQTRADVLDLERELQTILDATTLKQDARQADRVQVRILEVGHPEVVGAAIEANAYHVLHLSCHGLPGALELEDEDGRAVRVTAAELLEPIRRHGRSLPLILLNACHTGVHDERPQDEAAQNERTASFAEALLRAGVPAVLATLTSITDDYATDLARAFYQHLAASHERPLASRALAAARKDLERERQLAIKNGAPLHQTEPEYATVSLFLAGEERPLADFARAPQPLRTRPAPLLAGPVPQLRIGDLIGRRKELRETMRTLRDPARQYAGVVLTGLGGVGKSAVAGRAMQRLAEDGWLIAAHAGRFDLAAISLSLGVALLGSERHDLQQRGQLLTRSDLDDRVRLQVLAQTLAQERVLLVLDDFEQNLDLGGSAFLDPATGDYLSILAQNARTGRLLLTCRYPVPGTVALLRRVAIGPLSAAETRKLLQRLPSLVDVDTATLRRLLRTVGGHPRMLELLDAVLHGGRGRLLQVTQKLQDLLARSGLASPTAGASLDEGLNAALTLGARDVLLEELLALVQQEGMAEPLLQTATSNLPVPPAGLARMLTDEPWATDSTGDVPAVELSLVRLEELSLVHRFPDGTVWVHRWTAEGLARLVDLVEHRARFVRAGQYRVWRVGAESQSLEDGIEAVRCFLAGQEFDSAVEVADGCFDALRRLNQTIGIGALAAEILETLPESHDSFAAIADEEARAHLVLGFTDRALHRYRALLNGFERLVAASPARADYQHNLSAMYQRMGDLYGNFGHTEQARDAYGQALVIQERLAAANPDRADYQFALSALYHRMGDLYEVLGEDEQARDAYSATLAIIERLAAAEPDYADYQRNLSVSYNKMGDLYRDLGQIEQAHVAYSRALAIRERLVETEPDRADYQRDLSASYYRLGRMCRALGQDDEARQYFEQDLAIAERLAQAEPDRADYQNDLSTSYSTVGDLYRNLGLVEQARLAYARSLAIVERLAAAEPNRVDYQRDLVTSLTRVDGLAKVVGMERLQRALSIVLQMKARGQLKPIDEPLIDYVRERLRERGAEP